MKRKIIFSYTSLLVSACLFTSPTADATPIGIPKGNISQSQGKIIPKSKQIHGATVTSFGSKYNNNLKGPKDPFKANTIKQESTAIINKRTDGITKFDTQMRSYSSIEDGHSNMVYSLNLDKLLAPEKENSKATISRDTDLTNTSKSKQDHGNDHDALITGVNEGLDSELIKATENGNLLLVEDLINQGGNIQAMNNRRETPLFIAVKNGYKDITRLLITKGANINEKCDSRKWTPIYFTRDIETFTLLLNSGADVNITDDYNWTPLHYAALQAGLYPSQASLKLEEIKLLLKAGANVSAKTYHEYRVSGSTALHLLNPRPDTIHYSGFFQTVLASFVNPEYTNTIKNHHHITTEIAKLLIANGANVNTRDIDNLTPLYYASGEGNEEFVKLLLDKGADADSEAISDALRVVKNYKVKKRLTTALRNKSH